MEWNGVLRQQSNYNFEFRANERMGESGSGSKRVRENRLKVHLAQVQYPIIFWRNMRKSCWRRQRTSSHNILAHMWQQQQQQQKRALSATVTATSAVVAVVAAAISSVCHAEMKDALNISLWINIYTGYFCASNEETKIGLLCLWILFSSFSFFFFKNSFWLQT